MSRNDDRAERAYRTVLVYGQYAGEEDEPIEDKITDLATDLLHLGAQYGLDAETLIGRMERDFEAEVEDPES